MELDRSIEWATRVVAWHNRHPLARRVVPANVVAPGWVSLPCSAADKPRRRGWRMLFGERFLPPLSVRRVARWALRHGVETAPAGTTLPVREVPVDNSRLPAEGRPALLWVASVAIEAGSAQTRVLLGGGPRAAVLGTRLWSWPRCTTVLLLLAATAAALCSPGLLSEQVQALVSAIEVPAFDAAAGEPAAGEAAAELAHDGAVEALAAVSASTSTSAASSSPSPSRQSDHAPETSPRFAPPVPAPASRTASPAPAPRASAAASAPAVARLSALPPAAAALATSTRTAAAATFVPPVIRPHLSDAAKAAAREAANAARAMLAAQAQSQVQSQSHVQAKAPQATAAAPAVAWALAMPHTRTQAESQLVLTTLAAALARTGPLPGLRLETLPAGDDWRAVCWPFTQRAAAERLRALLLARGVRVELVQF